MFKIEVPVQVGIPFRQICPRTWATIEEWQETTNFPMDVVVNPKCSEKASYAVPKKLPAKIHSRSSVEVIVIPSVKDLNSLQMVLEDLAQKLGMEFGVPDAPSVGFTADC